MLLAKSERAAERLLESGTKYLEETLKLKVNREKSRTVSVFASRNFKFLGCCFGKNGKGIYIRVHGMSWKKAKDKLRRFTSRSRCGGIVQTMEKIKVYMRGWLNYCGIADMKNNIIGLNKWLCRRICEPYVRCCERTGVNHSLLLDFLPECRGMSARVTR